MLRPVARDGLSDAAIGLLELLERYYDDRPLTAAEIASAVGIATEGNRESRRRTVRFLASDLREAGHRVCGGNDGYWLARSAREWSEYLEAVRRNARYAFVRARRFTEASQDAATGQGVLF